MILVRYVLREHIAPFLAAIFVIASMFMIDLLVTVLDRVMNKGLPLQVILELFFLNMAWIVSLAVPMAVLVACLMAFGRLSGDQEITAVKAAGIAPLALMRPVLLVATLIAVLLIVFNNWILPEANHRAAELMSAISRKRPHAFIDEGRLITDFPGVQIWVQQIDAHSGVLRGVQIFEAEGGETPRLVIADSATIEYRDGGATILLRLRQGETQILDRDDPGRFFRIRFQAQNLAVRNVNDRLERQQRTYRGDREMPVEMMINVVKEARESYEQILKENTDELWDDLNRLSRWLAGDTLISMEHPGSANVPSRSDLERMALVQVAGWERARARHVSRVAERLEQEKKREAQYLVEIHKKFSIPMACLVFVLVGAPLGIMARRGGIGTGVIYSLIFFVIYWVFLIGGENLADRLLVDPALAMWSPNLVVGLWGFYVTWRMTRDNYTGNSWWTRLRLSLKRRVKVVAA